MDISTGNFTYHFPNKNEIVLQIYKNMVAEVISEIETLAKEKVSITLHLESHRKMVLIQAKYKFIYLNIFEIVTNHPEIRSLYKKNNEFERQLATQMFKIYTSHNVVNKQTTKDQFERVINTGQIINNTWLIDAEILSPGDKKLHLKHYMSICCGLLEPYLTEASLKEYKAYFKKLI